MALSLVSASAAADDGWSRVNDKHGVLVERRSVAGSPYYELRATTRTPLSPASVFAAVASPRHDDARGNNVVKKYVVLNENDHERLVYQQVHTPIVSDRDYTIRMEWRADPAHNAWEMKFRLDNAAGPPPEKSFVRIPDVHGYWHLEATPDGGTSIEYVIYSEPGGSVPAFLVRGAQVDSTRDSVLNVLAWAAAHPR